MGREEKGSIYVPQLVMLLLSFLTIIVHITAYVKWSREVWCSPYSYYKRVAFRWGSPLPTGPFKLIQTIIYQSSQENKTWLFVSGYHPPDELSNDFWCLSLVVFSSSPMVLQWECVRPLISLLFIFAYFVFSIPQFPCAYEIKMRWKLHRTKDNYYKVNRALELWMKYHPPKNEFKQDFRLRLSKQFTMLFFVFSC